MPRILIVEDNIILRKRIKEILLSNFSFLCVAEASDESETFTEIKKRRPDLFVIDICLAGDNGLKLTKKIKMRYPSIPVVINTNNDFPEYRSKAAQVGADYFLSKKSNTINDLVSLTESIFSKESARAHKICRFGRR
jgi:DNA-binding NarL/FixJ family response regulator